MVNRYRYRKRDTQSEVKKTTKMAEHLLKLYDLEYPRGQKEQVTSLKKFVNRASQGSKHKNKKLMYDLLMDFSKETKVHNLTSRMSTLLKIKVESGTTCLVCGKAATRMCRKCSLGRDPAVYCHQECQSAHWSVHKPQCKEKTQPWTSEEMSEIVGAIINKKWNGDCQNAEGCPIPIVEVADACARLFNCVCIYLMKVPNNGREMMLALTLEPPNATLPDGHNEYVASIAKNLSPRIALGGDIVLSSHIVTYLQNYRDWRAGATQFGFVGQPESEDVHLR